MVCLEDLSFSTSNFTHGTASSDSHLESQSSTGTLRSDTAKYVHGFEGSGPVSSSQLGTQENHRLVGYLLLKQQVGACRLGDLDSTESFPLFSREGLKWIKSRTGDPLGLDVFNLQPASPYNVPTPWPVHHSLLSNINPSVTDALPPRDLVEQYASAHFSSIMYAILPLVDPVRFNRMLDFLYTTLTETSYPPDCRGCIHIFLVFAAKIKISHLHTTLPLIDEDACVQATLALLPQILGGHWTITGLETILMLVRTSYSAKRC
jgi:hypothetical protein